MSPPAGFGNGLPPRKRRAAASSEPRKRRRTESNAQSRPRKRHLEDRYCEGYRLLLNQLVHQVAARFGTDVASHQYPAWQVGASRWSRGEQAIFYAALERLGKDNLPAIADAIGTKSIPEIRALVLLLEEAAARHNHVDVTLRDIPAAVEVGDKCNEQLELAADALAWNQEKYEARQERQRFGDYWLITPALAQDIEAALDAHRACLSCDQSKQKCDGRLPCSNCQKSTTYNCQYPDSLTKGGESGTSEQPRKTGDKPATTGIIEALPEAILLRPQVMLRLSKNVFMNRSPTIPSPWPHWSAYTSDIAQEPSIYRTAFGDLHNLVVSLTRRLTQTAIIQAKIRLQMGRRRISKSATRLVRKTDVLAAIDLLGMPRNGKNRWSGVARRCALRVYDDHRYPDRESPFKREIPWDELERTMTVVSHTADHLEIGEPRPKAARSKTPLPLQDLTLSDSDDSMQDETAPRDVAGRHVSPSLAEDSDMLAPELISLEQFDRQASRQEEEKLWSMLGLEPLEHDGESDDDEHGLSEDETIITLPNGWRRWTDYRPEWEEFATPPDPANFVANQKSLTVPPVLNEHMTEPVESGSYNTGASRQRKKPRQREPEVPELQTLSSRAYADRQAQALAQVESTGATSSGDEDISNQDSHDERMNQSMHSVDTDGRPSLLVKAGDENIDSRRKTRLAAHTDDELSEMDWNSFID